MTTRKGWDRLIPFDDKGNLMHYADRWRPAVWVKVEDTDSVRTLTYVGHTKGRSSALLLFRDPEGHQFPVFFSDADYLIPLMMNGVIAHRFIGVKRGQNFGLAPVK